MKNTRTFSLSTILLLLLIPIVTGILFGLTINLLMGEFFSFKLLRVVIVNTLTLTGGVIITYIVARQLMNMMRAGFVIALSFCLIFGTSLIGFGYIVLTDPVVFLLEPLKTFAYLILNFLFILSLTLNFIGNLIFQNKIADKEAELAQKTILQRETEQKLLAAQIHPHFLFNSLNLSVALIPEPEKAEKVLISLSEFLRYSLQASEKNLIPLEQELDYTHKYLTIQQFRFEDRMRYIIEGNDQISVPPLIIQPLVENCVKHNIKEVSVLQIDVKIATEDGDTVIRVEDNRRVLEPNMVSPGHGMDITRKRVELAGGIFSIKEGGVEIRFNNSRAHS